MKNIGIITHNYPAGPEDRQNAGIFVHDLAVELGKKNNVAVYYPGYSVTAKRQDRVRTYSFKALNGKKLGDLKIWNPLDILKFIFFFVGGFSGLSGFISKNKIEVNIVMWAFPSGVFAYLAKKIFDVPYVVWCLGSDIYIYGKKPIFKQITQLILRSASFVCADGIDLAQKTEALFGGKCVFIPSASKAVSKIIKSQRKFNITTITFVGRLENIKGPDVLIDSLIKIKNLNKFRINIIGGGSLYKELEEKIILEKLEKYVTFYGNVNDFQKISDTIRNSDWLVIPSRSDSIPLVFSEAMKCGTPIIASGLPDLTYLVKKYKVGYLFKPGNFRQLAEIIVKLPRLKSERKAFAFNTKKAAEDFNIQGSAKKILANLENI